VNVLSKRVAAPALASLALLVALFATDATAAAPSFTAWSTPVNLGAVVNSTAQEASPALSTDGLSLYFASDGPGGFGLRDIWVSQRPTVSAAWGAPSHLGPPINTTFDDFVPAFSSDGHWMFFASTRPGGFGGTDLWQSYRVDVHNDFGWQTPTNLGATVNTGAAENGNGYFDNGGSPQLFFGSDRLGPVGNSDLYVTNRQADGSWGPASRIAELSTPSSENRPTLRQDGLEIFFYSDRAGSAGSDIWTATRASVGVAWSTPVNLGPSVNSSTTDLHPYVSANGEVLFFASSRPGSLGSTDLYMTTRDATPTVSGSSVGAVEGASFSGAVATVTDANTAATAGEYTATIDWGDGSPASTGTVTGSGGSFTVAGNHTYAEEGGYTVTTTLSDVDTPANTPAAATSTATVADAALTASGTTLSGVEGSGVSGVIANFSDANTLGSASDFTASIDWGDGTSSTGTVAGSGGSYTVSGSHTYAEAGSYTVTVAIADDGGSSASATSTVDVADAAIAATCSMPAISGPSFSGAVAGLSDGNSLGSAADFTASIDWGDSASSPGAVTGSGGSYTVSGSHTYGSSGAFTVTTSVTDDDGNTASTRCNVVVYVFAPGGGAFVVGDKTATGSVMFWGAQWWKSNLLTGGSAPASFKGYASEPSLPSCGSGWSSDPGNGSAPPAGPLPAYVAVIVSSKITKSGPQISGNTVHIVIVKTNAGYADNPGAAGTGTVVATVC
jgi:hypothetical protein